MTRRLHGFQAAIALAPVLVFLWLLMHLSLPNRGGTALDLPFNSIGWLCTALSCATALMIWARQRRAEMPDFALGLLLLSASLVPATLINPGVAFWPGLGWSLVAASILIAATSTALLRAPAFESVLLLTISVAATIQLIEGVLQNFGISILSFGQASPPAGARPGGVFQQPNLLGSFVTVGIASVTTLLIRKQNGSDDVQDMTGRVPIAFLICYVTAAVALTVILASRMTWAFSAVVLAACIYAAKGQGAIRASLVLALILGLAIGAAWSQLSPDNAELIGQRFRLSSPRWITWQQTLDMILERPWLGYGPGTFEGTYVKFAAARHALDPSYPVPFSSAGHPHNELLAIGFSYGVLPVFGIFLLGAYGIRLIIGLTSSSDRALAVALLTPLLLHNLLEFPFSQSNPHFLVGCMLLAIICRWGKEDSRRINFPTWAGSTMRVMGITLGIFATVYFGNSLVTTVALSKVEAAPVDNVRFLNWVGIPGPLDDRYQVVRHSVFFELAINNDDVTAGSLFLDWAEDYLRKTPTLNVYPAAIQVAVATGEQARGSQLCSQAAYYFGLEGEGLRDIGCLVVSPVNGN